MSRIDVVSLVGSAVPAELRSDGHMACWLVMVDGQPKAGPFASREAALACHVLTWPASDPNGSIARYGKQFQRRRMHIPCHFASNGSCTNV